MQKYLPVLRARRDRRLKKQDQKENRARGAILSGGIIFSLLLAVLIIVGAFRGIDSLKIFDLIYATTQGGPVDVTNTLAISTYFQAIRWTNFGTAMSYAIVLWAMCYILAFILIRRWRKAMQG